MLVFLRGAVRAYSESYKSDLKDFFLKEKEITTSSIEV